MAEETSSQNFNVDPKAVPPTPIETPVPQASQLEQILVGWGNRIKDVFGALDAETKEMSRLRLLECNGCFMRTGNTCDPRKQAKNSVTGETVRGCGCNISAKSMSPDSLCPLGRWQKLNKNNER